MYLVIGFLLLAGYSFPWLCDITITTSITVIAVISNISKLESVVVVVVVVSGGNALHCQSLKHKLKKIRFESALKRTPVIMTNYCW